MTMNVLCGMTANIAPRKGVEGHRPVLSTCSRDDRVLYDLSVVRNSNRLHLCDPMVDSI